MEPEDGAVPLRRAQRHPHHRSGADGAAVASRLAAVRDVVAGGGRVLLVGTKRQASEKVAEAAKRCGQYYVNHRWLGGMMTNWRTISNSIKRLRELDGRLSESTQGLTKKETLDLTRERDKLERALGGIKEMGGLPDILFVIDTNKEAIAVAEANKLNIPVVAVLDSNSDPHGINFQSPATTTRCGRSASIATWWWTVLAGIQQEMVAAGVDIGGAEEPVGALPEEEPEEDLRDRMRVVSRKRAAEEDDLRAPEGGPVTERAT